MNKRERLIELLNFVKCKAESCGAVDGGRCGDLDKLDRCQIEAIADHLLATGVIVPPCKVGDTVYINGCFGGVAEPHKIKFMSVRISQEKTAIFFEADLLDEDGNPTGSDCGFWDHYIGESVFLTREEAEKALAKRSE